MTKTLTIDNGNTNPHIGLFEEESLVKVLPLEEIETIKSFLAKEHQKEEAIQAIISNVGDKEKLQQKLSLLSPKFQLSFITEIKEERSFLNMPVSYSMTLGDDRLCQAYFAWVTNRKDSVVVIDSGTFTTVDFVSPKGLLGGYIFPGPQTYLNSFQRGSDLPILELPEAPKRDILEKTPINFPDHTRRAIQESLVVFHKGVIDFVYKNFSPDKIILTGGKAPYFLPYFSGEELSKSNSVEHKPTYIHEALFQALKDLKKQ